MQAQRTNIGRRTVVEIVDPGLVAGWLGGLAALAAAVIGSVARGWAAWRPLQLFSAFILGDDALRLGWRSAVLGFIALMVVSGVWGVFFNAILPRGASNRWSVSMGVLYALVVFLLMTWLFLPWVNPVLVAAVSPPVLLLLHLIYGVVLPLALPLRRNARAERLAQRKAHV